MEELRVAIDNMTDLMDNYYPLWAIYDKIIDFRLVDLDKRMKVRPMVIGETLHWSLPKLVFRVGEDQGKMD